jgi:hypothetical protein
MRLDVNDDPEAGIIGTGPVRLDVNDDPDAGIIATGPVRLDVSDEADAGIDPIAHPVADQQEIERRRNLVRLLFNDFWSGIDDKPTAFVDRLNQAEDYLNERLAANDESWRLDAYTRATLRLTPPSTTRPGERSGRSPLTGPKFGFLEAGQDIPTMPENYYRGSQPRFITYCRAAAPEAAGKLTNRINMPSSAPPLCGGGCDARRAAAGPSY